MFARIAAPQKGAPRAPGQRVSDSSATFSGMWDFFMACCDIYKFTFFGLGGG